MTTTSKERARRTLRRIAIFPGWISCLLLIAIYALGFDLPRSAQYVPFALSLPLFGLPHGAIDHLVPGRLSGRGASARSVLGVVVLYAVLASSYLALWFASPGAAFALFIALTWFHWGQGDLFSLRFLVGAKHLRTPLSRAVTVIVRGGLPMLVPLLAFPEVYREVARSMVGIFASGGPDEFAWIWRTDFRIIAGSLFAALALFALAPGLMRPGDRLSSGIDAAETLLLALYFALVPPVLAIGVYFCLWHSLRHIARLMLLDGKSARTLERGRSAPAFAAFFKDAAPLTVLALAGLLGLYFAVPGVVADSGAILALYLVLISTLTLPHVAVVCFMDLRQRVWA